MREKLEAKKLMMRNMSMHCQVAKDDAKKQEDSLGTEVRSLLVAGTSLSIGKKRLQVIIIDTYLKNNFLEFHLLF